MNANKKTTFNFIFRTMIEIFILSIIQGVAEFLPISSSSHLILVSEYFEFEKLFNYGDKTVTE